ncbi:Asp-tRNA(Asn)/Glu-tRNA(Gln) amidotransferase subunit GatC [Tissierella sp. Yu-01]|uniref:Asp-tRNA(Asn)/Glu-tRNA(Gln) amidotransferase subunit GatC n=1 Tax=Tissierella sp. Yu-01 TaxID=3035694 RepID=UPI00240D351D|nr:Asp-tRNA(Asn)/Glu-tRNA(Gln) amidotransferase subunit GatC [Tissierella sp. Yu-01]WFA08914.1 Asp-tRNA(Asn)/Glu-tRNA(Gln) amidotransferase subunit GatC [Tissierella sp. Yu-01]
MISKDDVLHIANIAKLKFSDEELDLVTKKFGEVIEFFERIKEVDTENIEPTYQVNDDTFILKDHEENQTLTSEEVLQNTTEQKYGYFKIMRVVE